MKKVLIAINKFTIGGAEQVALSHANLLEEKGYEVYFGILYDTIKEDNFYDNLKVDFKNVIHFKFKRVFDVKAIYRVYKFLRRNKIDIVITHLFEANTAFRIAAILARTKKIFSFEHSCYNIKTRWQILSDKFLSLFTEKIICVSEKVLDFTAEQEKISKDKLVVLNQISDLSLRGIFTRKEVLEKFNTNEDIFVIVTVGRFSPEKNQTKIIEVADSLINEKGFKNFLFMIVGYGPEEQKLKDLIKNKNLGKYVKIIPDSKNAKEYLVAGNIFLLTSNREGMPIVVLEAMHNGLPVIATDVGGVSDIVQDNKNGFLVKLDDINAMVDKILFFYKNKDLIKNFKKEAIETSKIKNGKIEDLENIINN